MKHTSLYPCFSVIPFHSDTEFSHVICFGQRNIRNMMQAEAWKVLVHKAWSFPSTLKPPCE